MSEITRPGYFSLQREADRYKEQFEEMRSLAEKYRSEAASYRSLSVALAEALELCYHRDQHIYRDRNEEIITKARNLAQKVLGQQDEILPDGRNKGAGNNDEACFHCGEIPCKGAI